jgi:hypothetical protein
LQLHMAGSDHFHQSQVQCKFCHFFWKKTHYFQKCTRFVFRLLSILFSHLRMSHFMVALISLQYEENLS